MRLRRGETVPTSNPAQTPKFALLFRVIICAVLAGSGLPLHVRYADGRRSSVGAQITTRGADREYAQRTRESLLDYMARCAP